MNECKKCESLFEKALYNELNEHERKFFNAHIASCNNCADNFEELKTTLSLVKNYKRQEPDEVFMENFWERLEPNLKNKESQIRSRRFKFSESLRFILKWKYQLAGGLALLVLGFFIGKYISIGNKTVSPGYGKAKKGMNEVALNTEVSNYLDRSKILLLGITNSDPVKDNDEIINLKLMQKISKQLAGQATVLKKDLNEPSQLQLKRLVSNLELIMLQIANLETKHNTAGIELIKDMVHSKGIFLKINIQELMENSKKQDNPKNQNAQTKSESKRI